MIVYTKSTTDDIVLCFSGKFKFCIFGFEWKVLVLFISYLVVIMIVCSYLLSFLCVTGVENGI